jgi:hypothetical protein
MKKLILAVALAATAFGLSGCGGDRVNGTYYDSYGIFNEAEVKDPNVAYEISLASVIVAIIFSETLVIPVYIVGWDLYKPVAPRHIPAALTK